MHIPAIKILHVIDSGGFYGAETMLLDLMIGQKKNGDIPILCSIGTPDCGEKDIERHARHAGIEVMLIRIRTGLNLYGAAMILKYAKSNRVDLFHTHGYKGHILLGIIPKFIRKIPLVRTIHGWTNISSFSKMAAYEWLDCLMLKHADAVVVVNNLLLNDKRVTSAKIEKERLFVVNNGININDRDVLIDKDDEIYSFTKDGFIIGTIGRLSHEKGHAHLLEAVKILVSDGHDIKLVIIGDGVLRRELVDITRHLNIYERVIFPGYKNNAKSYLSLFDIFVISSLTEGLPITLLEAMKAEIPVVATRVGGIPGVLTDGETGLLVPPADPDALADAIRKIIDAPELGSDYARNSSIILRKKYTVSQMVESYMCIYKSIIEMI